MTGNGGLVATDTHHAVAVRQPPGRSRHRAVRRALELSYDLLAWLVSLVLMAWAGGYAAGPGPGAARLAALVSAAWVLAAACGARAGLYRNRYPRGSRDEALAVSAAALGTAVLLAVAGLLLVPGHPALPVIVAGAGAMTLLAMLAARQALFTIRSRPRRRSAGAQPGAPVIVFGAGAAGSWLIDRLLDSPAPAYRPVALLDDDPAKAKLRIRGVPVVGNRSHLAAAAARTGAGVLVIAIARASGTTVRDLTRQAERCGLVPKVIPTVDELLTGGAAIEGVRDPRISDLLGRRPVRTDLTAMTSRFTGQCILVTGAGGSIGAELCRQLHQFAPGRLVMLDRDESALHAVQLALHGRALLDSDETVLADLRDPRRIHEVFEQVRPQIVFHAAALKHLPLLERYPAEALQTNVWGTQAVLEAAAAVGTATFVNISTDKAVDPVSVLGYSKRLAERLTAHMALQSGGSYMSVRFGNVLGSRGSVLAALSMQVAAGGPVTITHPEAARYFMTADEAVQLVLQASVIGRPGEALVLDMGEQVKIVDMARRLAAGAPRPVDVVFTGLRDGEKLTEDLLGRGEPDVRPYHPLIRHVPVPPLSPARMARADPGAGADQLRVVLARLARAAPGRPPKPRNAQGSAPDPSAGPKAPASVPVPPARAVSPAPADRDWAAAAHPARGFPAAAG